MIDIADKVLKSIIVRRVVVFCQGCLPDEDIDHSHLFWNIHVVLWMSLDNILIKTLLGNKIFILFGWCTLVLIDLKVLSWVYLQIFTFVIEYLIKVRDNLDLGPRDHTICRIHQVHYRVTKGLNVISPWETIPLECTNWTEKGRSFEAIPLTWEMYSVLLEFHGKPEIDH